MQRIPEPELMDDPAQVQAYGAADFLVEDLAFVDRIVQQGPGLRIVDLGCGPGNITLPLAACCPTASVLGLDGAAAMLSLAEQRRKTDLGRYRLVEFRQMQLPLPQQETAGFSAVVSNSLLHHLHDPQVLWQAVRQLGAPGALVMIHDLRRPDDEQALELQLQKHGGSMPEILQRDYLCSLRAAFRPQEVLQQLQLAGLGQLQVEPREDRYLEIRGRLN